MAIGVSLRSTSLLKLVRLPLIGAAALDAARRELASAPEPVQAPNHEAYLAALISPERGARPSDLLLLDASALRPRSGRLEVAEEEDESAEAAAGAVRALAVVGGSVASGTSRGAVRLWSAAERAPLLNIAESDEVDSPPVLCATAWEASWRGRADPAVGPAADRKHARHRHRRHRGCEPEQ